MSHREQAEQIWHNAHKAFHAGDTFVGGGRADAAIAAIEAALDACVEACAKVALNNGVDCVCGETIAHAIRTKWLEND